MEKNVADLEAILDAEFDALSALEANPASVVANIIREVDYVYLYLRGSKQFSAEYTNYFETIHQYGWPGLLRAWYSKIDHTQHQTIQESDYDLTGWADSRIHAAGQIARCRQLVMFCKMGFGALARSSDTKFTYTTTVPYANAEAYDLLDYKYVQKEVVGQEIRQQKALDNFNLSVIRKRIGISVRRPHGVTIDYHPTSYISEYFARQGHHHLKRLQLDDDFGPTDLFGSIPYGAYVKMVEYLAGLALMHNAYCEAALKRFGGFEMRNVLSLFCSKEAVTADLARHLGCPTEDAGRMLAHVTLTPANHQEYLAITSAPPAPFVQISDSQLLRSAAGCLNNPFYFLNYELKRTCGNDYGKTVNNREVRFRQMLYKLFQADRFICVPEQVDIYTPVGNQLDTDIDAVIFDKITKTLGLFQLKWQAPFAHSMKKRRNFITNLQDEAEEWLEKVAAWVGRHEPEALLSKLYITKQAGTEKTIGDVHFFILGRHNIHFTGVIQDPRAAWGSWSQVVAGKARAGTPTETSDPIKLMHDRLVHDSPRLRMEREGQLLPPPFNLVVGRYQIQATHGAAASPEA